MYKIFLAFIFLFTGSLHAMDNPHDHGSHKHNNMTGVDGSKTVLDQKIYNEFIADLGTSQVVIIDVNGMVCDFCARGIEKTFYGDKLVKKVLVSLEKGKVLVAYDNAKRVDFGEIKNIFLSNGQSATGMILKKIT